MKFVDQTNIEEGKGNCFSACVASFLEIECNEVPNISFMGRETWLYEINKWLMKNHETCLLSIKPLESRIVFVPNRVPFIVSATINGLAHAVIMQNVGGKVKLLHDPHPSKRTRLETLTENVYFHFLIKL